MHAEKRTNFLFVHSTGPTHVHRRDTRTKTEIRRHVMRDIGAARRAPPRNPRLDDMRLTLAPDGASEFQPLIRPFWDQDPLAMLDQQWPMDVFSAYGIALLGTGGFLFPFAFTSSAFLRHFQSLYAGSAVLQAVQHGSSAKARVMALERSLGTIACIEGAIGSSDLALAAGDHVIRAVLAVICFNLLNMDYQQACVHIQGMDVLITSRGGIQSLHGNDELVLMVFWVDVMVSLLFDAAPKYHIPWHLLPEPFLPAGPVLTLPNSISKIISSRGAREHEPGCLSSCMDNLSQIAHCIQSELDSRGNAVWNDEMFLGLRLNPIVHGLFDRSARECELDRILEMIRLGGILWIIWLKQRSRSFPASPITYISKLSSLLCLDRLQSADLPLTLYDDALSVTLWLAILCAITSPPTSSESTMAMRVISDTLRCLGIKCWGDARMRLGQMPWISALDESCVEVWKKLE